MKKAITLILLILLCEIAKADMPGPAYQYKRYSENGKFYFKSIPYYNYDQTSFGKTIVYNSTTKKSIFRINNYLPETSFISNTGKSLATITYWMWGHSDFEKQELIKIYREGKKPIQFFFNDLFDNKSKSKKTVSHTLWYDEVLVNSDVLYVITFENKVICISLTSGKIIRRTTRNGCKLCSETKKLKVPKSTTYTNIKYPEKYIFPDLISGRKFHSSLIKFLGKNEVEEYDDCKYYISVSGTIDRVGNCKIFMIEVELDKKPNEKLQRKVVNWIIKQKYQTNLIPKNCDKWVFEEYFYLK